jgi:plasmid stabilization system protein ParE
MSVRVTETALTEIEEICKYIEKNNPVAAGAVAAAIERTIAAIEKRPNLAPIVHDGKVRAKLVERFQYRIFYESKAELWSLEMSEARGAYGLGRVISKRADPAGHAH